MPSTRILAAAIIVAGGAASRLGGIDKCLLPLGVAGKSLLESAVMHFDGQTVIAGPRRSGFTDAIWVDDDLPLGGPAAGVWVGLQKIESEFVFLVAGDQLVAPKVLQQLSAAATSDGAWVVDERGIANPLCAYVRTGTLRSLLEPTKGQNESLSKLLRTLDLAKVEVPAGEVIDFDTWASVFKFAQKLEGSSVMSELWLERIKSDLGIADVEIPQDLLLDLTREVAHNIERKLAPLTTFLIGYAAGVSGQSTTEVAKRVQIAVDQWTSSDND